MYIVANSYFLRHLRELEFFNLNLGKTRKTQGSKDGKESFRKVSEFELKYHRLYGRDLLLFGSIGKIMFYDDVRFDKYNYLIFKDEEIYEVSWTNEDMVDVKNYILGVLRKIDTLDDDDEEELSEEKTPAYLEKTETTWIAKDDKNNGKKYMINQNLSREEYREQLLRIYESKNKK